jgi:hypothetical protein
VANALFVGVLHCVFYHHGFLVDFSKILHSSVTITTFLGYRKQGWGEKSQIFALLPVLSNWLVIFPKGYVGVWYLKQI